MRVFLVIVLFLSCVSVSSFSDAGQEGKIAKLCKEGTNTPSKVCDCMGEKSGAMSAQEQDMIVAMMSRNQKAAATLRTEMSPDSMIKAGTFMANVAKECAEEGGHSIQ